MDCGYADLGGEFSHTSIVQQNCMTLVENMNIDWSSLTGGGVLTSEDAQLIHAEQSLQARNYLLLKLLTRKSKQTFDKFVEIVRRQQTHIDTLLVAGVEGIVNHSVLCRMNWEWAKCRQHNIAGYSKVTAVHVCISVKTKFSDKIYYNC